MKRTTVRYLLTVHCTSFPHVLFSIGPRDLRAGCVILPAFLLGSVRPECYQIRQAFLRTIA